MNKRAKNRSLQYKLCNPSIITAMDRNNNNGSVNEYYPITIIRDSNFQLSLPSQKSRLIKIAIWKDERLEHLEISKGLIELLQTNGFTIEMILQYGPSGIAKILGIDEYVAQIIFKETSKKKEIDN